MNKSTPYNYEQNVLSDCYELLKLARKGKRDIRIDYLQETRKMIDEIEKEMKK